MMRRALLAVLAVLVAAACGGPDTTRNATDRLRLDVAFRPDPLVSGRPAAFELRISNVSDTPETIAFDTTQRGDVRLSTAEGVEVYQWAERRAFAQEPREVTVVPGQRVAFPLEEARLPVPPGDYEVLATVIGLPKLQVSRTTVTVAPGAPSETPSPAEPTPGPTPEETPVTRLVSAADTTTAELALPLASALARGDAFDADGAVLRQRLADAFGHLTFTELFLAREVVVDGSGEDDARRAEALAAAARVSETLGRLAGLNRENRIGVEEVLARHVRAVEEYAAVVAAGGGGALRQPRQELEGINSDLGQLVWITAGGELTSEAVVTLLSDWTDSVTAAIEAYDTGSDEALARTHTAATRAVDSLALQVSEAYARHLDLSGYDTRPARIRQEISAQMSDDVFLLGAATMGVASDRAVAVLNRNAEELSMAVGQAPAIDASEERAFQERWRARDAAALDAVAGRVADDRLARADRAIARTLADGTDEDLAAQEVESWLAAQREQLLGALAALR